MDLTTISGIRAYLAATPDDSWGRGHYVQDTPTGYKYCALGHIRLHSQRAAEKLWLLTLRRFGCLAIANVNDTRQTKYKQKTAKKRILALLDDMIKTGIEL